jgi:osmotically-inducible protein OsmY
MKTKTFFSVSALTIGLAMSLGTAMAANDPTFVGRGVEASASSPGYQVVLGSTPFRMNDSDRQLAEKVAEALLADHKIQGRIEVLSLGGKVLLSGEVESVGQLYRVVEITQRFVALHKISVDDLEG